MKFQRNGLGLLIASRAVSIPNRELMKFQHLGNLQGGSIPWFQSLIGS